MVMTNKRLAVLALLAGAMLVATAVVMNPGGRDARTFKPGRSLIGGIDPDRVAAITIRSGDKAVSLHRVDGGFTVDERHGYPASAERVNRLLLDLLDIRCADRVTTSPAAHAELGVSDENAATTVWLADAEGKALLTLLIGNYASSDQPGRPSPGGQYVRLAGDDAAYRSAQSLTVSAEATGYLAKEVLKLTAADIEQVSVTQAGDTYSIGRDESEGTAFELTPIPAGRQAKAGEVRSVATATTNLSFEDVAPAGEKDVAWDVAYTCGVGEHLKYYLDLGTTDGEHYLRVRAVGPAREKLQVSQRISMAESEDQLQAKDAVLQAAEAAARFNSRHDGWVYRIPEWKARSLRKKGSELVEAIPDPDDPDKIAARHILIGYQGADRSEATRSRDEARAMAERILGEVNEEGADFASLASQYSEGPSAAKGGDLGEFGKGMMDTNFEAAAWKLEVDQVSGIVETPFGFHIIKRTK